MMSALKGLKGPGKSPIPVGAGAETADLTWMGPQAGVEVGPSGQSDSWRSQPTFVPAMQPPSMAPISSGEASEGDPMQALIQMLPMLLAAA